METINFNSLILESLKIKFNKKISKFKILEDKLNLIIKD